MSTLFANRIFDQKWNKSDKIDTTTLNDKWTRSTVDESTSIQWRTDFGVGGVQLWIRSLSHLENIVMSIGTTTTLVYSGLKCKSTPSRGTTLDYGKIL